MSTPTHKSRSGERRSLNGLFVRPRAQLSLCVAMCVGFVVLGGFMLAALQALAHTMSQLTATYQLDVDTAELISNKIYLYLRLALFLSFAFAVAGLVTALWMGHRFFGPLRPIIKHVDKLLVGDYHSRVRLRPGDDLLDVARKLNALAEQMESAANAATPPESADVPRQAHGG